MEYKKYQARTFQEAKLKMLLDIGNRAYIVSQKKVRVGGFFGLFGKPMIEITAGIMKHGSFSKKPLYNDQTLDYTTGTNLNMPLTKSPSTNRTELYNQNQEKVNNQNREEEDRNLRGELDEVKSLIAKILASNDKKEEKLPKEVQNSYHSTPQLSEREKSESEKMKELIKMFLRNEDFNDNFINSLCSLSNTELLLASETDLTKIKDHIKQQIAETIQTTSGINISENSMNIIVLVGPTGVGKTTTLAKLGAYFGVFQKKKVKFISIDTYRVGAIQQLKLYSDIMEIPFAKVNSIEELKIELYSENYDLVLIDTTGRNQKNLDEIRDIKKYLDQLQGQVNISLVISAVTKYKDLVEILDKFDILNYTNIIVTKLDETNTLGQVISALGSKKRSLSYVTFGQSVPEDIEEASRKKLFDLMLK